MQPFIVSPYAANDLNDIWRYISRQAGAQLADRTLERLVRGFGDLAQMPGLGHLREDLTPLPLRFYLVKPYLVIYSWQAEPLGIHAVLHTSRDVGTILRRRGI